VDAVTIWTERQKGGLMQQADQIEIGLFADQFQFEAVGLADGLAAAELG